MRPIMEMKNQGKKTLYLLLAVCMLSLCACGKGQEDGSVLPEPATEAASYEPSVLSISQTALTEPIIVGEVKSSTVGPEAGELPISLDGREGEIRIDAAGDYRLSGTLAQGQIVVDAPKDAKVTLILDGASVSCEGSAAIYARAAKKLVVKSAPDSVNLLRSTGEFVQTDENKVDAAIFAKCDLTLSGEGTVGVRCDQGHGTVGKDGLKIKSGTVAVEAAGQGLAGKDGVSVEGGTVSIVSGGDGIHSEHDDPEKGNIVINDGSLYIESGKDPLDASGSILIGGGSLNVRAEQKNGKGLNAGRDLTVSGGILCASARGDAVNVKGSVFLLDGVLTLSSLDDAIHADKALTADGGTLTVTDCKEGIEAHQITINGGTIRIMASDDGFNPSGKAKNGSRGGKSGPDDPFETDGEASLTVNGGRIVVNAEGDGLDSNGTLTVTGGEIYISGPTHGGNGALDYGIAGSISGGTVIAAGSADMAENFGSGSTQGSIMLSVGNQQAGSEIVVTDENGKLLASFCPEKAYQNMVVSAPGMALSGSYTVTAGSFSETVTLDDIIYGGQGGFGGGPGGPGFPGGGGPGGGRPPAGGPPLGGRG